MHTMEVIDVKASWFRHNYWINPLTGSDTVPTDRGELLTAVIAYWEDVLVDSRAKRPRKSEDRAEKERLIETAGDRLKRFRHERDLLTSNPKRVSRLALSLAFEDLAKVMRVPDESSAA